MTKPVVEPQFETKSNFELFQTLGKIMGFKDECFDESEEELISKIIKPWKGKTITDFKKGEPVRVDNSANYQPFADGKFFTKSGKAELWDNSLVASPNYKPSPEGHQSTKTKKFPVQLITGASHNCVNSSFGESEKNRKKEKEPRIKINPIDAKKRGIEEGSEVKLYSESGYCFLKAELTEDVKEGIVVSESLWWNEKTKEARGINFVTSSKVTDFGGCSTIHANLVEISKI